MKKIIIKILFRLLKIPLQFQTDNEKINEWLGLQYPLPSFHNYISSRTKNILQVLGEGVDRDRDYWTLVGQRVEINLLLTAARISFETAEKNRIKKQNENAKNEKG